MSGKFNLLLAPLFFALSAAAVPVNQWERTVLDGVYTEAQAYRGEFAFTEYCAGCHGSNLDGIGAAPALYSSHFLDRWREDSLGFLANYVMTAMPLATDRLRPGALSDDEYLDILSYLLWANGFPFGGRDLAMADLETTRLVGLEGPRPLPPSALVRVVGCLARTSDAWTLVRAGMPSRLLRGGDTTDAAELERSAAAPLGDQEFLLPNLSGMQPESELTAQISTKVQVKGVVSGAAPAARLQVLSFASLGQECAP